MGQNSSKPSSSSTEHVFTSDTPVSFSPDLVSALQGSPETDGTRAKDYELHIQRRVQSELSRLESETSKRLSEVKESISVPDPTSDSSEPGAAAPDQPSAKGDPETKASAKSKDLSSQNMEKEIVSLKEKLKRRRVKDDVVKDTGVEKAKGELVDCLRLKDRRPLDCWKEVHAFKEEVGRLEKGFLGKVWE